MEILERVASVEERAEYRRFVLTLAESAGAPPAKAACWDAAARPSDSERDALRAIAAILDR
jgi:hypothetical protein